MNECLIDFKYDKETLAKWYDRVSEFENLGPKEEFVKSTPKKGFYTFVKNLFTGLRKNCGVCCFTSDPDNALMWSHYTESHKGIALGFNIMPVMQGGQFFIQPVDYLDQIIAQSYFTGNEETLRHLILTKSSIWSYEKEWRVFQYYQNGLFQFNKACLKEVIFGYRTTSENKKEVLIAIKKGGYRGIAIKEIVLDKTSLKFKTEVIKHIR
ncbi:DUF2971 domain-containing protein [Larkinella terrae]|nr:DUF2971 domain-containing protein [Larkinella terrae]